MEFEQLFEKVKWIVWKCEKDYYLQLWDHEDWEQEAQIVLFELQMEKPEILTNDDLLYKCFKTKFRNYVNDKLRRQESDKRKINKIPYIEINEISHKVSSKEMYLDEMFILREALNEFKSLLNDHEKNQYEALLANKRFSGRAKMKKRLEAYLKEYQD